MSPDHPSESGEAHRDHPGDASLQPSGSAPVSTVKDLSARPAAPCADFSLDAILDDQRRRWQRGEGVPAAEYLQRSPGLAADVEAAAEVVYQEFVLRQELGDHPAFEDYLRQFPAYAVVLRLLYEADHLVGWGQESALPGVEPPERFGDYELLGEIARGGMGVVYKARQMSLDRIVALKMISSKRVAAPQDLRRFHDEAQAAARLQHPNIVAVHEVGEHQGQPFFTMDYVEGSSLAALVREHSLPAPQAAGYVRTLAEAMYYAHENVPSRRP